jgi:ABC-type phosphate/phosphonate transport system ATPase subunit
MAQEILIIGQSGTGKSSSLRNLNPTETVIINPTKKNLPFKGFRANYTVFSKDNPTGNLFNIDTNANVVQALSHINDKMPNIKMHLKHKLEQTILMNMVKKPQDKEICVQQWKEMFLD